MRGQAQGQLASGGMSHHDQSVQVDLEAGMLLQQKTVGRANVLKRPRPSTADVAYAPVFNIEGSEAGGAQRFAEMSAMSQAVLRPPIAAVNVDQNCVRGLCAWQPRFEELIGIGAIRYALIETRLRLAENVLGEH